VCISAEFEHLLTDQLDLHLSPRDVNELFSAYDKDGLGEIEYEEFLLQLRGNISERRLAVLNWAFDAIDADKSGFIDMNDMLNGYNAEGHPKVVSGAITSVQALRWFIKNFDVGGIPDGKVTRKEFSNYYKSMSAGIDSDQQFIDIVKSAWKLQGKPPKPPSATSGSHKGSAAAKDAPKPRTPKSTAKAKGTTKSVRNSAKETARRGLKDFRDQDLEIKELLTLIRTELRERGAYEVAGVRTKFRRADRDGTQSLNIAEFKDLLTDQLAIRLSEADVKELFEAYDADGYGGIDYEEFLLQINGKLNPQRKAVLNWAFDTVDLDKDGIIDMNDLLEKYDADHDPDVVAKVCTAVGSLKRFIKGFDVGRVPDGKVTRKEFARYYKALSAGIDDDDKFIEIMKSAWDLRGDPPNPQSHY